MLCSVVLACIFVGLVCDCLVVLCVAACGVVPCLFVCVCFTFARFDGIGWGGFDWF